MGSTRPLGVLAVMSMLVMAMLAWMEACSSPYSEGERPPVTPPIVTPPSLQEDGGTGPQSDGSPLINTDGSAGNDDAVAPPDGSIVVINDGGVCNGAVNCTRVVFVTHDTFNGQDIDSVANADQLCSDRAKFFNPSPRVKDRTFVAWLSVAGAPASSRHVHGTGKYINPNNVVIANNWNQLTSAPLLHHISVDSTGTTRVGTAWTGTTQSGAYIGANGDCGGWNDPSANGVAGDITVLDLWSNTGFVGCASMRRLYCIEK